MAQWSWLTGISLVIGGLLADPVTHYPGLFGANSIFGGPDGVTWMKEFPYALPNLLSASLLLIEAVVVFVGLRETLESRKWHRDRGLEVGRTLKYLILRVFKLGGAGGYTLLGGNKENEDTALDAGNQEEDIEMSTAGKDKVLPPLKPKPKLPVTRIWTRNVLFTLLSIAVFDFHMG